MAYGHLTLEQQRKIALEKGDHEHAEALAREASQHIGPKATQMEREGKASERGDANRATATRNRAHRERLGELHRELSQVNGEIATEQAENAQVYRMADAQAPTVGWWKAARARAAMHPPTPTQAHAQAAGPAPSPKQSKTAPTPPPARPLSPAEAFEKEENESRLARIMREREEANARYYQEVLRSQNTEPPPQAARPSGDIKPPRDPEAWWTDPKDRDPPRPTATDLPEMSRVELRTEQLRQHRGQRRTPPRR